MGSECSIYKDYELEEPIESSSADWTLYPAHSRGDKTPIRRVSVFVHGKSKKEKKQGGDGLQKSTQFLKVLRHPAILKYYSSHDGSDEVAMVTEPVEPLENVLADLSVDEIIAGLHNIVEALVFLHDNGGLSHNNVGLSSVYVGTHDGSWKLGGMQCVCKFAEVNNEFLDATKPLRDAKSVTPEEKDSQVNLTLETNHSLDAYGFGMLVCDVLDSRPDIGSPSDKFGELMQSSFLYHDPKMRPQLNSLLTDVFFRNDYLEVVSFLTNITIKSDIEKEKFFSSLVSKLQTVSADVVAKRLLPRLLSRFVLAEPSAEKEFLPHLLSPGDGTASSSEEDHIQPILPMNLFKEHCVPILSKLWTIKDLHVRLILLKFFPLFARAYDKDTLQTFIITQMLIGLRDTDDTLVAATFHALAPMATILGGEVVVGGERQKYFSEGRPKFSLGSSPQIKHNTFSTKSGNEKQPKANTPVNVLDALHMENKLKTREEKPSQKNIEDNQKQKESRQRHKKEIERKREQLRKERERKKAEREKERLENEKAKTLLEVAREHTTEREENESKQDEEGCVQTESIASEEDVFEEWEDFDTGEPQNDSPNTKLKTSPTRFHSSRTSPSRFDITDVDFTPRPTSAGSEKDLISWDNHDATSGIAKPEVDSKPLGSGKGMKLSSKKPNVRDTKPKAPEGGDLGKMFEIPEITFKSREPDFFSDMQPELEFKRYDGGVGGANVKTGYSANMSVEDMTQVEAGWEDEEWTDFS